MITVLLHILSIIRALCLIVGFLAVSVLLVALLASISQYTYAGAMFGIALLALIGAVAVAMGATALEDRIEGR